MGWTGIPSGLCGQTPDQFFRNELGPNYEVLASATKLTVYYAAVRDVKTDEVWAFVALMQGRNGGEFYYKDMDENMGPCECDCPERILDLLSPTTHKYALEWRERCRAKIAERKARPKLKTGMTVRLVGAEQYGNYDLYGDTFVVDTYKRYCHSKPQRCFRSLKSGLKVRYGSSARWEVVS